jgi:hypothetical protein
VYECVCERERESVCVCVCVCVCARARACVCAGVFRLYGDLWNEKERGVGGYGDKVDWYTHKTRTQTTDTPNPIYLCFIIIFYLIFLGMMYTHKSETMDSPNFLGYDVCTQVRNNGHIHPYGWVCIPAK